MQKNETKIYVRDDLVIEFPLDTPSKEVLEGTKEALIKSGITFTCFDTFRIPARINVVDAYRIIVYLEKDV